jgi:hypothetical protein
MFKLCLNPPINFINAHNIFQVHAIYIFSTQHELQQHTSQGNHTLRSTWQPPRTTMWQCQIVENVNVWLIIDF